MLDDFEIIPIQKRCTPKLDGATKLKITIKPNDNAFSYENLGVSLYGDYNFNQIMVRTAIGVFYLIKLKSLNYRLHEDGDSRWISCAGENIPITTTTSVRKVGIIGLSIISDRRGFFYEKMKLDDVSVVDFLQQGMNKNFYLGLKIEYLYPPV